MSRQIDLGAHATIDPGLPAGWYVRRGLWVRCHQCYPAANMHGTSQKRTIGWTAAFLLMLSSSACEEPAKINLSDTEGRSFTATCKGASCSLVSPPEAKPSAPQPEGAEANFVLHVASRLFAVCEVWVQGSSHAVNPADCRALTCKTDADCPPAKNMSRGACTNGLCTEPSSPISSEDAVLLCLSGTGAPTGATKQVERYALGNACSTPCNVPSVCRQP